MAQEYDLTSKIAPFLDRHLVFPLLEFLQERRFYPLEDIMKAKLDLVLKTNMVEYAMEIYKELYNAEPPADMDERRKEVLNKFGEQEQRASALIQFLQNPNMVSELRQDRQYNLQMLQERYQIGNDQIEALYDYAKFQFECGLYSGASDFLYQYRTLGTNTDRNFGAVWGKFAAELLMQNWDLALEEMNRLKEIIDSKNFALPLQQLQQRTWLMHWGLFVFFNHENGRNGIIDMFFQDRYMNAIQTNAHHLLRYLAVAVVVNKRRRNMLKDLIKVIQQERHTYKDPITEFLLCLFVDYDFEGAQQMLRECEEVLANDYFAASCREEFIENARMYIFENYCRLHSCIDLRLLAGKLNMTDEEAERWVVNLIRNAKLDAKIDSKAGTVIMNSQHASVYEQIIEKTKNLGMRTYMLHNTLTTNAVPATAT